ncbi:MAG: PLDc N-terminal domain-containing protein [Lachnospiraceae bacterium]|nr:PLDc N-terminal domain-containing protein [Lachnospiraceae bacterium]MDE6698498.1 PLDc N-terminal domain-containing protein [Lachnospiraceae bacterium]
MPDEIIDFLPFIIPLVIAEFILLGYTLKHILTHKRYKRGTRPLWILVTIIGMQFIGPILYFLLGKEEE